MLRERRHLHAVVPSYWIAHACLPCALLGFSFVPYSFRNHQHRSSIADLDVVNVYALEDSSGGRSSRYIHRSCTFCAFFDDFLAACVERTAESSRVPYKRIAKKSVPVAAELRTARFLDHCLLWGFQMFGRETSLSKQLRKMKNFDCSRLRITHLG
jgi:hypothetical protein